MEGTGQGPATAAPAPAATPAPATMPEQEQPAATPATAAPAPAAAAQGEAKPKGGPDDAQRDNRLAAELAAAKQREAELQAKLDAAKTAEDVQKAVDEAKAEAARQVKSIAAKAHLAAAGCLNSEALVAAAHIDVGKIEVAKDGTVSSGLDAEKLKADFPYLFEAARPAATVTTGAPAAGAPATGPAKTIKEGLAALRKQGA